MGGQPETHTNGWQPNHIPNPIHDFEKCGRAVKSTICDPDNILLEDSKNIIQGFINEVQEAEIGVLAIKKMDDSFSGGKGELKGADLFAQQVHNLWGIGDVSKKDGILVFLSTDDRVVFISTGSGVEEKLNAQNRDVVINNMKPYLRAKQYGTALEHSVVEIKTILRADAHTSYGIYFVIFLFLGLLCICGAIGYVEYKKSRRLRRGKELLKSLMEEVESDENGIVGYVSSSCPICLEDFPLNSVRSLEGISGLDFEGRKTEKPAGENTRTEKPSSKMISIQNQSPDDQEAHLLSNHVVENAPNRPMSLPCKHIFCFSCLSSYLKTPGGDKCPICRRSVDPSTPPPERRQTATAPQNRPASSNQEVNQPPGGSFTQFSNTETCTTRVFQSRVPEYQYRMNRMHTLYPEVVTSEVYQTAVNSLETGSVQEFRRIVEARQIEVNRIILNNETREAARSSGASGSNIGDFGGGESSGGSGGTW